MASSSSDNGPPLQAEVVVLSDCDGEDTETSSIRHCSKVTYQKSTPVEIPSKLTESPDSKNFTQFLDLSRKHMRFPGDEKIVTRLRKHHSRVAQTENIEAFFESLCSRIRESLSSTGIYIILNEAIQFLKNNEEDGKSDEMSHNRIFKRRVRKLEKRLEELDRKIKEVQAREVSMDDSEEETNFIIENRLKERFVKVYEYLCKLMNSSSTDEAPKIRFGGTRYPELNKKIQKYLNKSQDEFPDYPTVLKIVSQSNEDDELRIVDVESIAKEAFAEIGKILKKRRMVEDALTFGCYLTDDVLNEDSSDPANSDPILREQLEQNSIISKKREEEELEKYVREQKIKEEKGELEPREVEDDEAEYQSIDDEEEEVESDETEEDIAIIEDRTNYPSSIVLDSNEISSDSTEPKPRSPNGNPEITRSSKRQRNGSNPEKQGKLTVKIPKHDEDIIVLSD